MTKKGQKITRTAWKKEYEIIRRDYNARLDELSTAMHEANIARYNLTLEQGKSDAATEGVRKAQAAGKFWLNAALAGWTLAVVMAGVLIVR